MWEAERSNAAVATFTTMPMSSITGVDRVWSPSSGDSHRSTCRTSDALLRLENVAGSRYVNVLRGSDESTVLRGGRGATRFRAVPGTTVCMRSPPRMRRRRRQPPPLRQHRRPRQLFSGTRSGRWDALVWHGYLRSLPRSTHPARHVPEQRLGFWDRVLADDSEVDFLGRDWLSGDKGALR